MARLPQPGSDRGVWGNILNEFLSVEHNADGTLKATGSIASKYTKPGSGIPMSDLAALSITDSDIASGAAIVQSKIQNLTTNLASKANVAHNHVAADVTDFNTQVRLSRLDQMATPTADVAMGGQKIAGLGNPTGDQDAMTKAYTGATYVASEVVRNIIVLAYTAEIPLGTPVNTLVIRLPEGI